MPTDSSLKKKIFTRNFSDLFIMYLLLIVIYDNYLS